MHTHGDAPDTGVEVVARDGALTAFIPTTTRVECERQRGDGLSGE
jgi:hypothetical protein